jgi:pyrroloquinoline quinone (PQQ) biosynthesis protein C
MFNWDLDVKTLRGLIKEGHRYRHEFSTPLQSWLFETETEQILSAEFERIWAHLEHQDEVSD